MKRLILCFMILLIAAPAETNAPLTSLSFDNIKISTFLRTVYQETLGTDYVLEPEVVADERLVNVRGLRLPRQKETGGVFGVHGL